VGILNACANVEELIREDMFRNRSCREEHALRTCMHAFKDAQTVFDKMAKHDVVSWTTMILTHLSTCEQGQKTIAFYEQMQQKGVEPDHVTYLKASGVEALEEGRHVHE
jgi:hypothetical protein